MQNQELIRGSSIEETATELPVTKPMRFAVLRATPGPWPWRFLGSEASARERL